MGYGRIPVNVERKDDTTKNGSKINEKILAQNIREQFLYPLRINEKTTILVPKEKCNDKYRLEYLKRINAKATEIQLI